MSNYKANKLDNSKIIGSIVYSIFSFIIPVFGIVFSIILLKKAKTNEFPSWVKYIAIISIIYQMVLVISAILGGLSFISLQHKVDIITEV